MKRYAMILGLMNMITFIYAAVALYFVTGLLIGLRLFKRSHTSSIPRNLCISLGYIALFLHATVLYQELITESGLNLSFFNAVSLTAFTIVALLLFSSLTKPVENLGILILPLAAITLLLNLRFPGNDLLNGNANWALRLHVISSLLAYALLTLASAQAILLAIQDSHLRRHHPGGFVRTLPPLQTMESLLFEMIGLGFALLTITLFSGFIYLDNMFAQHVAHKTILSILAWIAFAVLLWGRFRFGWRGRTAIRWTLLGFMVLMLAYFGSKAILELVLQH